MGIYNGYIDVIKQFQLFILHCVNMKYRYMPMDSTPLLCPNPNVPIPSQQGGSMSIWSYMTAAIVATTVASNMVNNVNSNNNLDNQNINNINMNAGENSNMNMNLIMPGGKRSLETTVMGYLAKFQIAKFICLSMHQEQIGKTSDVEDILQKMMAIFSGFA